MKSLFARIFLYVWLAMVLSLVATAGVATTYIWKRTSDLQRLLPGELALSAEQQLLSNGVEGLKKWAKKMQNVHPGLDVFVVDASGKELTLQEMPDFMKRRIAYMVQEGYLNKRADNGVTPGADPFHSAPQVTAANGAVYTLMFAQAPAWSREVLGTVDVQLLQSFIVLAISGWVSWYLARTITRPVKKLQVSARALANGNLDARVGDEFTTRKDELSVLAHDFDQMADRLRGLIDSKERLLRDVSHELRTPLARLRLALGLARREGANLEREHDRIEREAERLDELIGYILWVAQLDSSQPGFNVQHEWLDLAAVVGGVVEDARIEATAQGKRITLIDPGPLKIQGVEGMLHSAIENVVRNAVRFTAVGTAVEVTLQQQDRTAVLIVRDHGPGVPEAELSRLFEPFYRVQQQARERDTGGYGLGLAITWRVMVSHGGEVNARNAVDGGLIVTFSVPMDAVMTSYRTT